MKKEVKVILDTLSVNDISIIDNQIHFPASFIEEVNSYYDGLGVNDESDIHYLETEGGLRPKLNTFKILQLLFENNYSFPAVSRILFPDRYDGYLVSKVIKSDGKYLNQFLYPLIKLIKERIQRDLIGEVKVALVETYFDLESAAKKFNRGKGWIHHTFFTRTSKWYDQDFHKWYVNNKAEGKKKNPDYKENNKKKASKKRNKRSDSPSDQEVMNALKRNKFNKSSASYDLFPEKSHTYLHIIFTNKKSEFYSEEIDKFYKEGKRHQRLYK